MAKLEIIEATNQSIENNKIKIFLAGGITNCPDWQKVIIDKIKHSSNYYIKIMLENVTIFNPRRKNFPIEDPNASKEQITWEYERLRESNIIVFWFSKGSLNPIVLYELGRWGNSQPVIQIIGMDKEYERKSDVLIQTKLSKPETKICDNLDDFYDLIMNSVYNLIETDK